MMRIRKHSDICNVGVRNNATIFRIPPGAEGGDAVFLRSFWSQRQCRLSF